MKLQYRHEHNHLWCEQMYRCLHTNHLWCEQMYRCLHTNSSELLLNQKLQVPTAILECSSRTFPHDVASSSKASVHTFQTKQHHIPANIPHQENPEPHTQPQYFTVLKHITVNNEDKLQCTVNNVMLSATKFWAKFLLETEHSHDVWGSHDNDPDYECSRFPWNISKFLPSSFWFWNWNVIDTFMVNKYIKQINNIRAH
jgi:hypothetical protein